MTVRIGSAFVVVLLALPTLGAEPAACAGQGNPIHRAVRSGQSTAYHFCDGSVVSKRPDGTMALKTNSFMKHPEYASFMSRETAALEVAEHNARVLRTDASYREAGRARAAFDARMKQFQAKLGWSKEKYFKAVKVSTIAVEAE